MELLHFLMNTGPRGISRDHEFSVFQNAGKWILGDRLENTRPRRIFHVFSVQPRVIWSFFYSFFLLPCVQYTNKN